MQNIINGSITSGSTTSCWLHDTTVPSFQKLNVNITTDVVIVGGGITGLTNAYTLLKRGKQVIVLEDGEIGSGKYRDSIYVIDRNNRFCYNSQNFL